MKLQYKDLGFKFIRGGFLIKSNNEEFNFQTRGLTPPSLDGIRF